MSTVNVDAKLAVNKFFVDEDNAHIRLKESPNLVEFAKLEKACPAGLYKKDEGGGVRFDYAGCLECGTCRILCGKTVLEKWEYPNGSMGVVYRHG
jgi:ferredoxin like protein